MRATLVHVFPLKNLENLTFRRHCSSPGKVVSHHKTLLYVQFLDRMQNMKLHLFLCLDFAKIRVRTIDQKRQNFSLFDRKTLCITQLQCKLISNYFIYLIHVYFKSHTWYMQECCRTRISSSRLAFSTGTNVKVQKPCITMIECLDKSEVPIVTMVFLPITKFLWISV